MFAIGHGQISSSWPSGSRTIATFAIRTTIWPPSSSTRSTTPSKSSTEIDRCVRPGSFMVRSDQAGFPGRSKRISSRVNPSRRRYTAFSPTGGSIPEQRTRGPIRDDQLSFHPEVEELDVEAHSPVQIGRALPDMVDDRHGWDCSHRWSSRWVAGDAGGSPGVAVRASRSVTIPRPERRRYVGATTREVAGDPSIPRYLVPRRAHVPTHRDHGWSRLRRIPAGPPSGGPRGRGRARRRHELRSPRQPHQRRRQDRGAHPLRRHHAG